VKILKSNKFPGLETERLILRRPSPEDAKAYHQILSCPDVSHYSDVPHNPTEKRSQRFISWMSKLHSRGTGVGWILTLNDNNQAIGSVRINSIEKKAQYGVIAYELHPDHWGCGLATEALGAVVSYAHQQLSLNRLEAWTSVDNTASQKVLISNGFQLEGKHRQKVYFRGQLWDVCLFGRLATDKHKL